MRLRNEMAQSARFVVMAFLAGTVICSMTARTARAGERKFLVILATSPKQFPDADLANPETVRRQYFDKIAGNAYESFAEYWEEVSYGDVTISGQVTDWVNLPWRIQPVNDEELGYVTPELIVNLSGDDLNVYHYGRGEAFLDFESMVIVDLDGDPFNADNGPFSVFGNPLYARGSGDGVFTPGERFLDIDDDGKWDGLDERWNEGDYFTEPGHLAVPDGKPDLLGPWIDLNEDGTADNQTPCIYLEDSDNDGNPDCCPNGPGTVGCEPFDPSAPDEDVCPATVWDSGPGGEVADCNGNLIPDDIDIAEGTSRDRLPLTGGAAGCEETPDDIPDECQFLNYNRDCVAEGAGSDTCNREDCMPLPFELIRTMRNRCEFDDSNGNNEMDEPEPFENYIRSSFGRVSNTYIRWNYPGDVEMLIERGSARELRVEHNPLGKRTDADECFCADGSRCPGGQTPLCVAGYHAEYNPPDYWEERGSTKLNVRKYIVRDVETPKPDWFEQAWRDRYDGKEPPSWYDVAGPGPYGGVNNRGGANIPSTEELDLDPAQLEEPPDIDDDLFTLFESDVPRRASLAEIAAHMIYPEQTNGETEDLIYYDGWVEHDDLPSSKYHGGGDQRLGEVTSPFPGEGIVDDRSVAPFGADTSPLPSGDGNVTAAGPYATGIHGDLGHDAGNILNLEILTWRFSPPFNDGKAWAARYGPAYHRTVGETHPYATRGKCDTATISGYGSGAPCNLDYGQCEESGLDCSVEYQDCEDGSACEYYDRCEDLGNACSINGSSCTSSAQCSPSVCEVRLNPCQSSGDCVMGHCSKSTDIECDIRYGCVMPGETCVRDESCISQNCARQVCVPVGFRDYNLDGLLDQGEVRLPDTENYLYDDYPGRGGRTPGTTTLYPWNRQRLLEDCIEVLDDVLDFDDWVDPVTMARLNCPDGQMSTGVPPELAGDTVEPLQPNGVLSGIVLLPSGATSTCSGDATDGTCSSNNDCPAGQTCGDYEVVMMGSPGYYPIHNEDGLSDPDPETLLPREATPKQVSWNLFVHDLVKELDPADPGFKKVYAANRYLQAWEGFQDLFDFGVFQDGVDAARTPVGRWDIMAGDPRGFGRGVDFIHSIPIFKEKPCTRWVDPVDLATIVTPGVETTVTIPPSEFVRDDSHYFLEREDLPGERYYFWNVGSGLDANMPGAGLLILHTDVGANPDAPPRNEFSSHFAYEIVQADGLHQLDFGEEPWGDTGDPWPGATGATQFNCSTNPAATWHTLNTCTGLRIVDIVPDQQGSMLVTFNWRPMCIPTLEFKDPPGGTSVKDRYQIRMDTTDLYGGTWIRFFFTDSQKVCNQDRSSCDEDSDCTAGQFCTVDTSIDPTGGNFVGITKKTTPGTSSLSVDWNFGGVPDGRYLLFAELIPGRGADGDEREHTLARAGRNNVGNGQLSFKVCSDDESPCLRDDECAPGASCVEPESAVNANKIVTSGSRGEYIASSTAFRGYLDDGTTPVSFSEVEAGDQLMTHSTADNRAVLREIGDVSRICSTSGTTCVTDGDCPAGQFCGDLVLSLASSVSTAATVTSWQVVKSGATARSETWVAECVDVNGGEWRVNSSLTQPVPPEGAASQDPYPHAFTGTRYTSLDGEVAFTIMPGAKAFAKGDTFTFTTTGITAPSAGVTILNGRIKEGPTAVISADRVAGPAPLVVSFDGRDSFDPEGRPLAYLWDFGDGTSPSTNSHPVHTFTKSRTFRVVLRVTNQVTGRFGEASINIEVTNNPPTAHILADPLSGSALPLKVAFDAGESSDPESEAEELIYEWDFGDGTVAGTGHPGEMMEVVHYYSAPGVYLASLIVSDDGGKQDTATVSILVGNTLPVPNVTHSSRMGRKPHTVTFTARDSFDADDDRLWVKWIWGDGMPDEEYEITGNRSVQHTYVNEGTFDTFAVIRDERGGKVTWPGVKIIVSDAAEGASDPVASFEIVGEVPLLVDETFEVDASQSFDRPTDGSGQIMRYTWDWGDESGFDTGVRASHAYSEAGEYDITLRVQDNEPIPNMDEQMERVLVIEELGPQTNEPPTAVFVVNPTSGVVGERFSFDASGSTDPDGDDQELSYSWSLGDGTTAAGVKIQYSYDAPGRYLVRLTVRDELNAIAQTTQEVRVSSTTENRAPFAYIGMGRRTGTSPLTITFDGKLSYDPDGDALVYEWYVDDEVVPDEGASTLTVTFTDEGTYRVQLLVYDGDKEAADTAVGRSSVETIVVLARATVPDDDDGGGDDGGPSEPEPEVPLPTRPTGTFCGLGMVMGFVGSLFGLLAMLGVRRRRIL
ncbi:MAG: PKD domain-containing protein [Phycisphaerales bacterium]|nr:MAG: PKD domain-containing protein [Phycisphaerales bacterium]